MNIISCVLFHVVDYFQDYSCGKGFIQLSEVKTWTEEGKSLPENVSDKIRDSLLKDFDLKTNISLSDKVDSSTGLIE